MKFMVCFGLSRATYLIVLCSFFVASRIIECLIVNGMYVIDIFFLSDGGEGEGEENDKMKLTNVKGQ